MSSSGIRWIHRWTQSRRRLVKSPIRFESGFRLGFARVSLGYSRPLVFRGTVFRERQLVSLMSFCTSTVNAAVSSESEAKSLARPRLSKM